jgi:hypothetical protein
MTKTPCHKCLERHAECHSNCEKYREWKLAFEKGKAIIHKKRQQDRAIYEHWYSAYKKNANKHGKKV